MNNGKNSLRIISIIMIIIAIAAGAAVFLKPGMSITYLQKVNARVVSTEDSKSKNNSTRASRTAAKRNRRKRTFYYVDFVFTDENGFEQQVKQNVSLNMYEYYSKADKSEVRGYYLYEVAPEEGGELSDGYYLTEKSGDEALKEYKKSHRNLLCRFAEIICWICILPGIFLLWMSIPSKKSAKRNENKRI